MNTPLPVSHVVFLLLFGSLLLIGHPDTFAQPAADHSEELIQRGKAAFGQGDYAEAYTYYRQAQARALDSLQWAEATFLAGKVLTRQMQLSEGQATLDSVISFFQNGRGWNETYILARRERAATDMYGGDFFLATERMNLLLEEGEDEPAFADSLRAMCLHTLGITYIYQNQLDEAQGATAEGLEIRKRIYPPDHIYLAYSENSLGAIESSRENYQASLDHYLRAQAILENHLAPGHPQLVQVNTNIGIHYAEMGLFWKALEYHKANLDHAGELPPEAHMGCLLNLGSTLMTVGDYQEALEVFDRAEALLTSHPEMQMEYESYIESERSGIYKALGDYEKALGSLEKAIQQESSTEDYGLVQKLTRKGILLAEMGDAKQSRQAFEKAISLGRSHLSPHSMYLGQALEFFGESLIGQGDLTYALSRLEEAEDVYKEGEGKWNLPDVYRKRAQAFQAMGKWEEALSQYRKAWKALMPELPFQLPTNAKVLEHWPRTQVVDLMSDLGTGLFQQAQTTGNLSDLEAAWIALRQSLALVDSQRQYYESAESRRQGMQLSLPLYESAIQAGLELARRKSDKAYLEAAFLLSESSKAGNLREHLQGQRALRFAGLPDSLLEQEQYFRQRLYALDVARFAQSTDSLTQRELRVERFEISQAYKELLVTLEQQYPLYYQLRHDKQTWAVSDLQQALQEDETLYAYFWGKNAGFVFHLQQDNLKCEQLNIDGSLNEQLQSWLHFISQPPGKSADEEMAQVGSLLTSQLLPDLPLEGKHLVLIPDGGLGYLAFESLLASDPGSQPYFQWDFLGKEWEMTYAYAVGLWLRSREQAAAQKGIAYLGFAPNFGEAAPGTSRAGWAPLKFNQEEVEQAAGLLGGKALIGAAASEQACKDLGVEPYLLHFATHAIANDGAAMQSFLVLSEAQDSLEDGKLYAWEVYGLQLNSPLTVLSACRTGQGPMARGEGIMSLARAFQYAGSQQVLTTLWQADDQSGKALSEGFFKALKSGQSASTALNQSRKQYLGEADNLHAHPYFWAGYILIGDGGKIGIAEDWGLVLWSLLLGVGTGLGVAFFGGKKRA